MRRQAEKDLADGLEMDRPARLLVPAWMSFASGARTGSLKTHSSRRHRRPSRRPRGWWIAQVVERRSRACCCRNSPVRSASHISARVSWIKAGGAQRLALRDLRLDHVVLAQVPRAPRGSCRGPARRTLERAAGDAERDVRKRVDHAAGEAVEQPGSRRSASLSRGRCISAGRRVVSR